MIRDARVLRAGFVPREVEHRDAEVNHLSSVLEPITNGEPADTVIVTGPSGVGKTCVSKFVTERLREEVLDVEATYVNCWRNYSRFRTLYQILDDIGATIDIHRQSTPHDELVDRLQQYDGPRTVVILDEVDQLEDPSVIYDLHSLPQFAIICIANKEEELFSRVDDRLVSRLRSSEHVRMDKYHNEQLYDILSARTKWGLEKDVITDDQLFQIADAAAGDARLAIGMLRSAASTADRENHEEITNDILLDAAEDARAQKSSRRVSTRSPLTNALSTTSCASTALSGRARFTTATQRRSTTLGQNGLSARTSRRWSNTTSSRRRGRVEIESTRSSIRLLRHRCSDRDAVSYPDLNSPSPDCSWSSRAMIGVSSLPRLLIHVDISSASIE